MRKIIHCDNPRTDPTVWCAGCGVAILARAPRVTLPTGYAVTYGGTDWHPGCWDAARRGA